MRLAVAAFMSLVIGEIHAQELFINTEPASNMPKNSYGFRIGSESFLKNNSLFSTTDFEGMYELTSELMVHGMIHASNYYGSYSFNNVELYAKYRLYTDDGFKSHFRIAGFIDGAIGAQRNTYSEAMLNGGNSGANAGLIFTLLEHKLALSSTISATGLVPGIQASAATRYRDLRNYDYSVSAGYLVYPELYSGYSDLNVNLYVEFLGKYILYDQISGSVQAPVRGSVLDVAPGIQFIINSIARIDVAPRFRLVHDVESFPKPSILFRYEQMFYH